MKNIIVIISMAILLVGVFFSYSISQESKGNEINYKQATLVSVDYKFPNGEFLYKPWKIRINDTAKEIIVFDRGNLCFYVFTLDGKFIRKIGNKGQGPGEMMTVDDFFLDSNGDIYMLDQNNNRISIFSKEGKFIDSYRPLTSLRSLVPPTLFMKNGFLIVNIAKRGYYFTILNKKGEVIKDIGEIEKYPNVSEEIYTHYAYGFIIIDLENNYNILLQNAFIFKRFNDKGELKLKMTLDKLFPKLNEYSGYKASALEIKGLKVSSVFTAVRYKNERFFIGANVWWEKPCLRLSIYEFDNKLALSKMHTLYFDHDIGLHLKAYNDCPISFDVLIESTGSYKFIIPDIDKAEIHQFLADKK